MICTKENTCSVVQLKVWELTLWLGEAKKKKKLLIMVFVHNFQENSSFHSTKQAPWKWSGRWLRTSKRTELQKQQNYIWCWKTNNSGRACRAWGSLSTSVSCKWAIYNHFHEINVTLSSSICGFLRWFIFLCKHISVDQNLVYCISLAYKLKVFSTFCLVQGRIESLHSLVYPCRRDTKRGLVQYINTSAPVQLR